mmetsp:Transcript_364/g.618  ORF Transcript_364/g.618 Transcript_364/m.618 type:complete len:244 (-) Transcript_364:108-839(-)
MPLSRSAANTHSEHLAQHEMVDIIPNFSMDSILLIGGSFGPFHPLRGTTVPLWFALVLSKSKVCDLKVPEWMRIENLQAALQYEKENPNFYPLPFYAAEVCRFILNECSHSLEETSVDLVGKLLGELMMIRWTKILRDLDVFKNTGVQTPGLRISNLTCSEIEKLRPVMLALLNDGADLNHIVHSLSDSGYRAGGSSTFDSVNTSNTTTTQPTDVSLVESTYPTSLGMPMGPASPSFKRRHTL